MGKGDYMGGPPAQTKKPTAISRGGFRANKKARLGFASGLSLDMPPAAIGNRTHDTVSRDSSV